MAKSGPTRSLFLESCIPPVQFSTFSQPAARHQRSLFKLLSVSAAATLLPYLQYYDQFVSLESLISLPFFIILTVQSDAKLGNLGITRDFDS